MYKIYVHSLVYHLLSWNTYKSIIKSYTHTYRPYVALLYGTILLQNVNKHKDAVLNHNFIFVVHTVLL